MYKFSNYKKQYKANLKLALPIILAQLGQVVVQLVDNIMVGNYGGENPLPLAAASFGGSVFFMLFVAGTGITMGITPLIGELFSQKNRIQSAKYLQSGILFFTILGFVVTLIQLAFIPVMSFMGQPEEVVVMSIPYYKMLAYSMAPVMLFYVFKQFLEGVGNTKAVMYVIVTCNLANVLFNWIFINGRLGFAEMGAEGAGLGTLLSRIMMPIFIIGYFYFQKNYKQYLDGFSIRAFSWSDVKSLLRVGIPISSQMFLEVSAFAGTSIIMGWLGTAAISANQITMSIGNSAFMIVMSIGAAATIQVSHSFGVKDIVQLKKSAIASYHLTMMWNVITATIFIAFRNYIPMLFTSNQEVIDIASTLMIFVALFQLSDGIQNISVGILRGIQDVKIIMPIAFVSYIVLNLPIGYLFGFTLGMGPKGMILGFTFGLTMAAVLMLIRIRKQINKLEVAHIK